MSVATTSRLSKNRRKANLGKSVAVKQNHIAFIIDGSGSMSGLMDKAEESLKAQISAVMGESAKNRQETYITVTEFSDAVDIQYSNIDVKDFNTRASIRCYTGGRTALYDAVGKTVESMQKSKGKRKNMSFVVVVITDGFENASVRYNKFNLLDLINNLQSTDKWSFVFQVPRGSYKQQLCNMLGIPEGNVSEWDATEQGLRTATVQNVTGINAFYIARSAGKGSVKSFYITDMSKVSVSKIKKTLDDITDKVKSWKVDKEWDITSFCNVKNGDYRVGAAFYQLTKTEEVQSYKKFLVMEKGKRSVYAGDGIRRLLNLPDCGTIKLSPGNHANYDIFIQSTSPNRKLVRGTRLIYWENAV